MFTGIVTALGTVREAQPIGGGHDLRLVIGTSPDFLAGPAPAVGAGLLSAARTAAMARADAQRAAATAVVAQVVGQIGKRCINTTGAHQRGGGGGRQLGQSAG